MIRGRRGSLHHMDIDTLATTKAFSGFAADDMDAARDFYGGTLGLKTADEHGMLVLLLESGARPTLVYPKPQHTPADYTVLNFPVDDIEDAVDTLVERGVTFERYDAMPQDERGIMREGGPLIAWFKDPAGNTLAVL